MLVTPPVQRLAMGVCLGWLAASCGTDAVGISECREVERARCAAAVSCGYPDVEECQRFYRDHCLHGVALDSVDTVDVANCVQQIESAGSCAAAQPDSPPSGCQVPIPTRSEVANVCDVVLQPELASACAFLSPASAATEKDSGGS
jgi:hypothetical protein